MAGKSVLSVPAHRMVTRTANRIEPLLYKVMNLTDDCQLSATESKEPAFLQRAVRDVYAVDYTCLNYGGEDEIKKHANLFLKCFGTTNVVMAFAEFEFDDLDLLSAVRNMRLQRLSITVPSGVLTWKLAGFPRPLFLSLTHLDIYQEEEKPDQPDWRHWCGLASLPGLTHLALSPSIATEILPSVVTDCLRLALVVLMAYSWKRDSNLAPTVT
ncbi:hypothetical protein B0H14DRAFT_2759705, partial [Mycena olivaceomarginata]